MITDIVPQCTFAINTEAGYQEAYDAKQVSVERQLSFQKLLDSDSDLALDKR